jgi:DNA invertase Pin-like site-specific DNA recombinase
MLVGYMRVSKADGSQTTNLQLDALKAHGVQEPYIYEDHASGRNDKRPGLEACLKSLREHDVLVVWKLDRLGRNLSHLVKTITDLTRRNIGFRILSGRLTFGIFASLAEFESDLISERVKAGLAAARARGTNGGRKFQLSKAQVRMVEAAMKNRDTSVTDLCKELKITRSTLYSYVSPTGELRARALKRLKL